MELNQINKFHPSLFFNDNEATKVDEQKHFGPTFDKNLSFEKHINENI